MYREALLFVWCSTHRATPCVSIKKPIIYLAKSSAVTSNAVRTLVLLIYIGTIEPTALPVIISERQISRITNSRTKLGPNNDVPSQSPSSTTLQYERTLSSCYHLVHSVQQQGIRHKTTIILYLSAMTHTYPIRYLVYSIVSSIHNKVGKF